MSRVSKEKIKDTQSSMKERRWQDMVFLREIIEEKLKWATGEKEKGEKLISDYTKQIEILKTQVTKLDGSIYMLNVLKNTKPSNKKEDK